MRRGDKIRFGLLLLLWLLGGRVRVRGFLGPRLEEGVLERMRLPLELMKLEDACRAEAEDSFKHIEQNHSPAGTLCRGGSRQ